MEEVKFASMKRGKLICPLILIFIIAGELILPTGCKKGDEIPSNSNRDLLTSTWWRLTQVENWIVPNDIEEYWIFRPDGTYYRDNGQIGTWSLEDNNQTLKLSTSVIQAYSITVLTETTLKFKYKYVDAGYYLFTALSGAKLTTIGASSLTRNSVELNGVVRTNKSSVDVVFEYGTSSAYGQETHPAVSKISALTLTDKINAPITGLNLETTYYYRIKAVNGSETSYGEDLTFRTFNTQTVNDINGNTYNTVTIGTQVWMAENLKSTNFKDGSSIPMVTDNYSWTTMTSPAYCWFNNDSLTYKAGSGALYNWFAVNTSKLCPEGWHTPSDEEWSTLEQFLGQDEGSKLYEYGTNATGFSAKYGGFRWDDNGLFGPLDCSYFWTSSEDNSSNAFWRNVTEKEIGKYSSGKRIGFPIRCVKDN